MKTFLVENTRRGTKIKIVLHNPPYEDQDVISRTKWKLNECIITDVTPKYVGEE